MSPAPAAGSNPGTKPRRCLRRGGNSNTALLEHPYRSRHVSDAEDTPPLKTTVSALIGDEIPFDEKLALAELPIGQPLAQMGELEDQDAADAVTDLQTASRLVSHMGSESGVRYGDVGKKWLWWCASGHADLDNEDLHGLMFESIYSRLCLRT